MAASLVVLQRTLGLEPYLIWSILCVPGVLFVVAGWQLGKSRRTSDFAPSDKSLPQSGRKILMPSDARVIHAYEVNPTTNMPIV